MKYTRLILSMITTAAVLLSGCGPARDRSNLVPAHDKPLVWWNRCPSDPETGEPDSQALHFNEYTYYVDADMIRGADLQGSMIKDYLISRGASIDRNGDGIIGYVLAIGDNGHNASIARTRGIRATLDTGTENGGLITADPIANDLNIEGTATEVKDGTLVLDGKEFIVRELASREMVSRTGATWYADAAKTAINEWSSSFGDRIDLIISNNDGMGLAMFKSWARSNDVPVFGYDAIADCIGAIEQGFAGSISQRADIQAYLTLRLIRNCLDGVDINTGIGIEDDAGNVLSADDFYYDEKDRAFYASNEAVTIENYQDFLDLVRPYAPVSHRLDQKAHPVKRVFLNIYNKEDDFLSQTYQPLLQQYAFYLNLDLAFVGGNGHDESSILESFDVNRYDAFAVNMVKTDNADKYTSILSAE